LDEGVVYKCTTTPHQFIRPVTAEPTVPTPLLLVYLQKGSYRLRWQDRIYLLGPGHWCLIDRREPIEYWTVSDTCESLAMTLRRPSDPEMSGLLDQVCGRPLNARTGVSRIMAATLDETFEQMNRISCRACKPLHKILVEMVWDAVREQLESRSPLRNPDIQCANLKAYIESHLADPGLSVDSIANACGMSVRSAQRAFALDASGSVSKYIWMRRTDQCAAALRDSGESHRQITTICYSWGFNSSSHFSRAFKSQYGVSPRYYRALQN
jgi:AraC-like DNA-binding protein